MIIEDFSNNVEVIEKNSEASGMSSEISPMTAITENISPIGLLALLTLVIYLAQNDNESNENALKDLKEQHAEVLKGLDAEVTTKNNAITDLAYKLAAKNNDFGQLRSQLTAKDNELADKDNELTAEKNKLNDRDAELTDLKDQLTNLKDQLTNLNNGLADID